MLSPVEKWIAKQTGLGVQLNPQTLSEWQYHRLKDALQYAQQNTAFYAHKLEPNKPLNEQPFTLPVDLTNNPLTFLAIPQTEVARVTTLAHSGTTSLRKRIFFSQGDLERTRAFFAVGMSTMVSSGDRVHILISNRTENSLGSLLQQAVQSLGATAKVFPTIRSVREAVEAAQGAHCIVGMPAEMFYLSRTVPQLRPHSVLLAADIAPPSVVKGIRNTWQCQVYTHHGHTEFGYSLAVDCQHHNGLHTRDAEMIVEVIDPITNLPIEPNELGEIVVTTLANEAMPLVRYRTGNLARLVVEPCGCGGILHRLSGVEGRLRNNIALSNGKTLNIYQLDDAIFSHPAIRGFNATFIKGESEALRLIIDAIQPADLAQLKAKLSPGVDMIIELGNADPFRRREKRRITEHLR